MKKISAWILKALAAGLAALLLLNIWCYFYYNVPVHYTNETGATEYRWESNKFYRKGTEGFAFGCTNNEGFNNLSDYEPGQEIEILLMGSSHMEGMNTAQEDNAAAVLNRLFEGEKYTYNIGTSGHTMEYCLSNLQAALDTYEPGEYVVIETRTLSFTTGDLAALVNGELKPIESHTGGLVELLQKLPYLRLMYTKYLSGDEGGGEEQTQSTQGEALKQPLKAELLGRTLETAGQLCRERGVQLILVYDPTVYADDEGRGYTQTAEEDMQMVTDCCEKAGVVFVDLTESYLRGYEQQHKLPYGFYNTSPGMGHMNSWGHELFARAVFQTINELEG